MADQLEELPPLAVIESVEVGEGGVEVAGGVARQHGLKVGDVLAFSGVP